MLHYLQGDPTQPQTAGHRIVAHVGDDSGRLSANPVTRHWPVVRQAWREWLETPAFALGETQFVALRKDLWVASLVAVRAQDRTRTSGPVPLRFPALRKCLRAVALEARKVGASVHLSRLPDWPQVEAILQEELAGSLEVYVYDAPPVPAPEA